MKQEQNNESPIDEIHRFRREISDRFGGDVAAIAADAARRLAASGRVVWHRDATNQALHPSGDAPHSYAEGSSPTAG